MYSYQFIPRLKSFIKLQYRLYGKGSVFSAYLFVLLMAFVLSSCGKQEKVSIPIVISYPITHITDISAQGVGNVTFDGGAPITAQGICWSPTSTQPNIDKDSKSFSTTIGMGDFTAPIKTLKPLTNYYARAFATNSVGTAYGSTVKFTTSAELPTFREFAVIASSITNNSAQVHVDIESEGAGPILTKGVCWKECDLEGPPDLSDVHSVVGNGGVEDYNYTITKLEPLTTYCVCPYAINRAGTRFGTILTFKTKGIGLAVLSNATIKPERYVNPIGGARKPYWICYINVDIINPGSSPVNTMGICAGPKPNPKVVVATRTVGRNNSYGFRTRFSVDSIYYVRPYAANGSGTAYGPEIKYTPPPAP